MIIMRLRKLIQNGLFFFIITTSLQAQFAPGVNWKKLESDHFTLIFPEEIEEQARSVLQRAEEVYRRELVDFGKARESRWPLILTNSSMDSNGYVTLAPRKSVWYGTPAAESLSSLGWYDLLTLHETRHMVQMDYMNQGFIRFLYFFGGELGLTAGIHLSVPSWYLEGDAVAAETRYSEGGRGRDPLFYNQMRVLTLDEDFSYQKFVNRSYKHFIPNQYAFGYFLASYIRREYGEESWNRILKTTAVLPLPAFGLYLGAKRVTGKSWTILFRDMMKELKEQWTAEEEALVLIDNEPILKGHPGEYTSYETIFADDSILLARKLSLTEPPVLVQISLKDGMEETLFRVSSQGGISSNGHSVAWTWIRSSALHLYQNWSDLVLLNLSSGKKTYLTRKARYLFPAYSKEGDRLAVVNWLTDLNGEIHILNAETGDILDSFPVPPGLFPAYPSWSEDDQTLYFTLQGEEGRSIASLDLEDGRVTILQDFSMETVKRVTPWKDYLLFGSNASGYENIMALDLRTGTKYQVSSRPYGVQYPYASDSDPLIYYSDTRDLSGNTIVRQDLIPDSWTPVEDDAFVPYSLEGEWTIHDLSESREEGEIEISDIQDYSLFSGKFNLHSWGISPNLESLTGLRFQVQSTDVMETMNWAAGGEYEINEKTWGSFLDVDWVQYYPVISFKNSSFYRTISDVDLWDVSSLLGLSFPMNLKRDIWHYYINPGVSSGLKAFLPVDGQEPEHYFPVNTGFAAYALLPGSLRAIHPLWGVWQSGGTSMNPSRMDDFYQVYTMTTLYTPGLFRNNSLTLNLSFEDQSGQYSLRFPFARGYESRTDFRTLKSSADYDFPLFYPDLAGGSFFYIQRVRGSFFYDFLRQESRDGSNRSFQSTGVELNLDMTLANQVLVPFSLGFRFIWLLDEQRPAFQLIFINAAL